MRVLYLLFLLPLGAFASCPAGLKLSNVPISTALPYCVKWESSSLGGCQVACPGVCVEFPIDGTKGPMETTGSECKLGGGEGGGDGDGGGDGGTGGDNNALNTRQIAPLLIGQNNTADLAIGFNTLFNETYLLKNYLSRTDKSTYDTNILTRQMLQDIKGIRDNTEGDENAVSQALGETNFHLKSIAESLKDDGGGSGGGKVYDELKQFHNDMFGPNFSDYNSGATMYGLINGVGYDIRSMGGRIHEMASNVNNLYKYTLQDLKNNSIEMNRNVNSIAEAIQNGGVGGGSGNGGEGQGIDYSKMPGSSNNPLQVAKADYESNLCSGDVKCFFDQGQINKKYDEKKEELKAAYKEIKTEVSEIFQFKFSGSGSAPKCFDMFSMGGKSYSVCPQVDGYWEILAAIMMFIFYFVALMIVVRR